MRSTLRTPVFPFTRPDKYVNYNHVCFLSRNGIKKSYLVLAKKNYAKSDYCINPCVFLKVIVGGMFCMVLSACLCSSIINEHSQVIFKISRLLQKQCFVSIGIPIIYYTYNIFI